MLIALLLAGAVPGPAMPCTRPTHYDGDAIRCADRYWQTLSPRAGLRIAAIDAPEINCGRRRRCSTRGGIESREYLRSITAGRPVTCSFTGTYAPGYRARRPVVDCWTDRGSLACQLVRAGHAVWLPNFDAGAVRRTSCRKSKPDVS